MPSAIEYSVGLKADVIKAPLPRHDHHLVEASVAGSAEFLGQSLGIHLRRIKDLQLFEFVSLGRHNVLFARTMTRFTGHARD